MFLISKMVAIVVLLETICCSQASANTRFDDTKLEYVSSWKKMPTIKARSIQTGKDLSIKADKGTARVVVFIASWCIKCQQILPEIQKLEKAYKDKNTKFLYIFAHDTESDAKSFIDGYSLQGEAILSDKKILEDFHQPALPTIYVGDRYEWIGTREISLDRDKLGKIEKYLEAHTRI